MNTHDAVCHEPGCEQPLSAHHGGIGCLPGRPGGRVVRKPSYEPTEADKRGHGDHLNRVAATPTVVDGWDARHMECTVCRDTWTEVRGIPSEDTLIEPDPHLRASRP